MCIWRSTSGPPQRSGEIARPSNWLARQRLDLARRLLEASDLTVDRIAIEAGFGSGTNFRQQFKRALGVAPSAYRRTFRVDPANAPHTATRSQSHNGAAAYGDPHGAAGSRASSNARP